MLIFRLVSSSLTKEGTYTAIVGYYNKFSNMISVILLKGIFHCSLHLAVVVLLEYTKGLKR